MDEKSKKYLVYAIVVIAIVAMISITAVLISSQIVQNNDNNTVTSTVNNASNNSVSSSDNSNSNSDDSEYIGGSKVVSQYTEYSPQYEKTILIKVTADGNKHYRYLDGSKIPNPDGTYSDD